jgi:hypothetical protein
LLPSISIGKQKERKAIKDPPDRLNIDPIDFFCLISLFIVSLGEVFDPPQPPQRQHQSKYKDKGTHFCKNPQNTLKQGQINLYMLVRAFFFPFESHGSKVGMRVVLSFLNFGPCILKGNKKARTSKQRRRQSSSKLFFFDLGLRKGFS